MLPMMGIGDVLTWAIWQMLDHLVGFGLEFDIKQVAENGGRGRFTFEFYLVIGRWTAEDDLEQGFAIKID